MPRECTGQARLHATAAGTRINLAVTGLPAHEYCRLVAVSRRLTDVAATWNASYDGSARIVGTTAIPEEQLTALRVESAGQHLLLIISPIRSAPLKANGRGLAPGWVLCYLCLRCLPGMEPAR